MTARLELVADPQRASYGLLPQPVHYFGATRAALSELTPLSLRAHRQTFGMRPSYARRAAGHRLIDDLEEAALCGRGGAHFPAAVKWAAARSATTPKTVVANGAEGEPLSRKDTALLELRPHLVLDGVASAAEAIQADEAVVWLHENNHAARVAVSRALAERRLHEDEPPIRIAVGPDRYLTGESSAVANAVTGGPALPAFRRRWESDRTVLVHNVETLARVALLTRGCDAAITTVLVSIATPVGIVVAELRTTDTIGAAVRAYVGKDRPHAVLLGGLGSSWAP
jgi:NADH:ubiquinone oxidoreductase subunit F (NADH-binding)